MKRKMSLTKLILVYLICLGFVSCASIVNGTKAKIFLDGSVNEPINIQTDYKTYENQVLPTTVKVKRGKKDSRIKITSENYNFQDILVTKKMNGWIWGNLGFGGIVGGIVDFANGAAWKPTEKKFYVNASRKIENQIQSNPTQYVVEEVFSGEKNGNGEMMEHVSNLHPSSNGNSFSVFLDKYITEWKKKGEFETTVQWKQRIGEENAKKILPELSLEAKMMFISQENERILRSVHIGKYDADNEIFEILSDVNTVYANIPLSVAPQFKESWDNVEKIFEYDIVDDKLFIKSALFKYDGREYHTVKVIKEQTIQSVFSNVNKEVTASIESQSNNVKGELSEKSNSNYEAIPENRERVYSVFKSTNNNRQIRLKKDCSYYLVCENPDNLKYVEKYFKKYIQSNNIKTTDNIEDADAIITGHSINIDGGLLFYMTVMDIDGTLLWLSEIEEAKKSKFERSVKSVVKHSCRDLAKAFKSKMNLPISSPLNPMHERISYSEFTTPEYSNALKLYQEENYKAAVKSFNKVIKSYPYFADAYFYRSIAQCKIRDINDGRRDMMYFHKLAPFDERFDEGCKYVYYEIALRSERRTRNALIIAGVTNAIAQGISIATGNKSSIQTVPAVNNTSISQTNSINSQKRICNICHGTGKNQSPSTVAQYGQVTYQYCDICKKTGTPHYHKVCFKCLGKKFVNY